MWKAFVFSMDAFVALMLILLAINSAITLSSVPKGYYASLEQAHDLAKDTLLSMRATAFSWELSYLDALVGGGANARLAIASSAEKAIPMQFGYRFDRFNANTLQWEEIYDSSTDSPRSSPRYGREQKKLSASYRLFVSSYDVPLNRGVSPYCYISCSGADFPISSPPEDEIGEEEQGGLFPSANSPTAGQSLSFAAPSAQAGKSAPTASRAAHPLLLADDLPSNELINISEPSIGEPATSNRCMSPCDVPRSLYSDGLPFVGQIRLTVYS
ncbi:hypothetical protein J4441_05465 [Candidatus Micrarchaeota archaeon]|nr:hypothetical protein [Candidatus Micrarchaeota archaeon]